MKLRFNTVDIRVAIAEIRLSCIGLRVANVYDIDNKTYLIKLSKPDSKVGVLIESGARIHQTHIEWPKNAMPSGFSMKLRKHLRTRRLEKVEQLGVDRIIDFQFGANEAAYHVIVELYDRGNIILTDHEYMILNILRPRTDENSDVRFAVREKYPLDMARQTQQLLNADEVKQLLSKEKDKTPLKKALTPHFSYGAPLIEHCLIGRGIDAGFKLSADWHTKIDVSQLVGALEDAHRLFETLPSQPCKGYISQSKQVRPSIGEYLSYEEFHPILYRQVASSAFLQFDTFSQAIDEFFSSLEKQKLETKAAQQERGAVKKLDNIRKDHQKRLDELKNAQDQDEYKAALIEQNLPLVDRAIFILRSALADQMDWKDIDELIEEAKQASDPVALSIAALKLDVNMMTLLLSDLSDEDPVKPVRVDVDLALSAYANAEKYYVHKRQALTKEQKTIEASEKALKNAEKKTRETLKEVQTVTSVQRMRKTYWFEKFLWFISSENYLIVGGRDQQQNEMLVKRYLRPGDLYVHAEVQGASSVVVKNTGGTAVPPKTLHEAGTMAICYSVAWEAKVVTSAYWVHHDQVSKTAQSGEYLTTGSFMIRGKKNFLPPTQLVLGFGVLFKVDEDSLFRHVGERSVRVTDEAEAEKEDMQSVSDEIIPVEDSDGDSDDAKHAEEPSPRPEEDDEGASASQLAGQVQHLTLQEEKDDSEESETEFPDTTIEFGQLRAPSDAQRARNKSELDAQAAATDKKQFLSRKQRKDVKKQKKQYQQQQSVSTDESVSGASKGEALELKEEEGDGGEEKQADESESDDEEESAAKSGKKQKGGSSQQQQQQASQPLKRGQKSKMKKMKDKYKDQDEEDRQLSMQVLASAGSSKEKKKDKKKKGPQAPKQARPKLPPKAPVKKKEEDDDGSDEEREKILEEENIRLLQEIGAIDSLTGSPVPEDTLLFAVPVCAPYATLTNYKFKVKLQPGTGKRGKAARSALNLFFHDKSITARERDVLKAIKDEDLSRNWPGKVKISAPNLLKSRNK